jgi:hypothetical protein
MSSKQKLQPEIQERDHVIGATGFCKNRVGQVLRVEGQGIQKRFYVHWFDPSGYETVNPNEHHVVCSRRSLLRLPLERNCNAPPGPTASAFTEFVRPEPASAPAPPLTAQPAATHQTAAPKRSAFTRVGADIPSSKRHCVSVRSLDCDRLTTVANREQQQTSQQGLQ